MKFLAVSTNSGDPRPFVAQESIRVQELVRAGSVQQFYLKADWSGSAMILHADNPSAARSALDTLPLVVHGITTFDLTEILDPPPAPSLTTEQ